MNNKELIIKRIDELLGSNIDDNPNINGPYVYSGTLSIASMLYGETSSQVKVVKDIYNRVSSVKARVDLMHRHLVQELTGLLKSFRYEIENGLIVSIQNEARGEIFSDFLAFAKETFDEGSKDVAAVLVCAALEDCLKKFAESKGIEIENKTMSEVVNLLKSNGLLKKPEAKIVQSYVTLRNKAFHADWDKISGPEISSVIGYVENFILINFSG